MCFVLVSVCALTRAAMQQTTGVQAAMEGNSEGINNASSSQEERQVSIHQGAVTRW